MFHHRVMSAMSIVADPRFGVACPMEDGGIIPLPLERLSRDAVFVGLVTFERVLQSGVEDHGYARRIARLRAFYFDNAPEFTTERPSPPAGQ